MPIAINPVSQRQKRDVLDRVVQGLQAAQAVAGAYKDVKEAQAASAKNQTQYVPWNDSSGDAPPPASPVAADGQPGPTLADGLPNRPQNTFRPPTVKDSVGPGGERVSLIPKDDAERYYKREADLRGEVSKTDSLKLFDTATANMGNILDGMKNPSNANDAKILLNTIKLINPNVSRSADGAILDDGSVPSDLAKRFNQLFGQKDSKLLGNERQEIFRSAADAYARYHQEAQKDMDVYSGLAKRDYINPQNIGLRDRSALLTEVENLRKPRPKTGAPGPAAKPAAAAPPPTVIQGGHTFHWNPLLKGGKGDYE